MIECRFFGGQSIAETAAPLGVSEATLARDWRSARAWLAQSMRRGDVNDGFVRSLTQEHRLAWTRAEEFVIPMGTVVRAEEVLRVSQSDSFATKVGCFIVYSCGAFV